MTQPISFTKIIDEYHNNGGFHKDVEISFNRHALPNPITFSQDRTMRLSQWKAGVEERIIDLYGNQDRTAPNFTFDINKAAGIPGHAQQIQQELLRADVNGKRALRVISDTEADAISGGELKKALSDLYNLAKKISQQAKKVDWKSQTGPVVLFFPVINKEISMV